VTTALSFCLGFVLSFVKVSFSVSPSFSHPLTSSLYDFIPLPFSYDHHSSIHLFSIIHLHLFHSKPVLGVVLKGVEQGERWMVKVVAQSI
jgi:hypothetical protein